MDIKQIPAYRGDDKYLFVSYAHRDSEDVYPVVEALIADGYRVWYDEGIEPGDDWAESIGSAISKAALVLFFASATSVGRDNVTREIVFAKDHDIPVLTVKMGDFAFPAELERMLLVNQIINLHGFDSYMDFVNAIRPVLEKYGVRDTAESGSNELRSIILNRSIVFYENEKRKRKISKLIAISAAVFAILTAIFGFLFRTVPNVVELDVGKAQNILEDSGFKYDISLGYSERYEYGTVTAQNRKGLSLRLIPVVLTQSIGPEENLTVMPDTVGQHISDGAAQLIDAGMTRFTIISVKDTEREKAHIDAQSIPAGLKVSRENNVKLDVASNEDGFTFVIDGKEYRVKGDNPVVVNLDDLSNLEGIAVNDGQADGSGTGKDGDGDRASDGDKVPDGKKDTDGDKAPDGDKVTDGDKASDDNSGIPDADNESGNSVSAMPGTEGEASGVTPTPGFDVTPTTTPAPIADATPTAAVTPTPLANVTPAPIADVTPTAAVTPTPLANVTPTAIPEATPTPEATPIATPTPTVIPTPTATPIPTATPTPTPEPTPTPLPEPRYNSLGNGVYEVYNNEGMKAIADLPMTKEEALALGDEWFEGTHASDSYAIHLKIMEDFTITDKEDGLWTVTVPAGRTLTIANGGRLQACVVIEKGAKIVVNSGGRLWCTMGGEECIINYGTVEIKKGGELQSMFGGTFNNLKGATLTLNGKFYCGCVSITTEDGEKHQAAWFVNKGKVKGTGEAAVYSDVIDGDRETVLEYFAGELKNRIDNNDISVSVDLTHNTN